jgi:hypothetical protein
VREQLELDDATTLTLQDGEPDGESWLARNRKLVVVIGASALALIVVIVIIIIAASGDGEPDAEPEVAAGQGEAEPVPVAEKQEPAPPAEITVELSGLPSNATVTVGGQEAEPPLKIPKSGDSVAIAVRADGYEAFEAEVVPDRDQTLAVEMSKIEPVEEAPVVVTTQPTGQPEASTKPTAKIEATPLASAPEDEPIPEPKPKKKKKKNVWATNPF